MKTKIKPSKISVIIATRNRVQEIITCLNSISMQTRLPDEVVIVDASDKKELPNNLKKFRKLNIKYIYTKIAGLCFQRNLGIKYCSGDLVLFSDDDTIWDMKYLEEMIKIFENNKNAGAVTGFSIQKKKSLMKKLLIFIHRVFCFTFFLGMEGNGKTRLSGLVRGVGENETRVREVEFLYGFSMMFRKEVLDEFKFDENMKGYVWNDDDDIAYRVSRKYTIYYAPFAKILHNRAKTARDNQYLSSMKKIDYHYYLFKKNIPQDIIHKVAFWWSVVGFFFLEIAFGISNRNSSGIRGFLMGLKNILK